jgi:hypothetical protein
MLLLLALFFAPVAVVGLSEDQTQAIVKFRYHGTPRVKCSNCRIGGTNYAPGLLGDGVACVLEADGQSWDCELPEAVRRFRVARNNSELIVLADRSALVDETGWSFAAWQVFWGVLILVWRFLLQFIRGPVSGHLTSWWISGRTKKKRR